jgi:hypothetical protein
MAAAYHLQGLALKTTQPLGVLDRFPAAEIVWPHHSVVPHVIPLLG